MMSMIDEKKTELYILEKLKAEGYYDSWKLSEIRLFSTIWISCIRFFYNEIQELFWDNKLEWTNKFTEKYQHWFRVWVIDIQV